MAKLRCNSRQHTNLLAEETLKKKNLRQPLKCKKNVINDSRSMQISKNLKESHSMKNNELSKTVKQKIPKMSSSVEADILKKRSETVPLKSPERATRSSSRLKKAVHSKEVNVTDKIISLSKSKKQQNVSSKKKSHVCQIILLESPNKGKIPSFYRCSLTPQCIKKSQGCDGHCHNTVTDIPGVLLDSLKNVAQSSRHSMELRFQKISEKNSGDVQLPNVPEPKQVKSSTVKTKQQKAVEQMSECIRSNKHCSLAQFQKNTPTVGKNRKSEKLQIPGASLDSPEKVVQSSRHSMELRFRKISEKNSGDVQLPNVPEPKQVKSSTVKTKQQKAKEQMSERIRRSNKHRSLAQSQKNIPTVGKNRKSKKLQIPVMSKSFSGRIPIDDLALSPNPVRKVKSEGFKLPAKNTLKRKRYIINAVKKADENYEDDIFEDIELNDFCRIFPDASESENSLSIQTPKLGFHLTPVIHSKTPVYRDCYSPIELAASRKLAEEYMYRSKKRKRNSVETPGLPEKKKLEFKEVLKEVYKAQEEAKKLFIDESDNEDNYFTDLQF